MLRASNGQHFVFSTLLLLVVGILGFTLKPILGLLILSLSFILYSIFLISSLPLCATGGFVAGFTLFFSSRPLYIIITGDYFPVSYKFNTVFALNIVYQGLFIAVASMVCFVLGSRFLSRSSSRYSFSSSKPILLLAKSKPSLSLVRFSLILSIISTLLVYGFASFGKGALYSSALGAYAYQLPILLQGFCLASAVISYERFIASRRIESLTYCILSICLIISVTIIMRDISLFRAFYISGFLAFICSIAYIRCLKKSRPFKLKYLILFTLLFLPVFSALGANRYLTNDTLLDLFLNAVQNFQQNYALFFSERGDLNVFDTFLSALQYKPDFYPYLWSWIYVPLHFIPRAFWPSKPIAGITQDLSFMNGAPYSPGLNGFFLLDGGLLWLFVCMFFLGLVLARIDVYLYRIPQINTRAVCTSVVTIYSIFLPRYFLWQYTYGILALLLPSFFLMFLIKGSSTVTSRS